MAKGNKGRRAIPPSGGRRRTEHLGRADLTESTTETDAAAPAADKTDTRARGLRYYPVDDFVSERPASRGNVEQWSIRQIVEVLVVVLGLISTVIVVVVAAINLSNGLEDVQEDVSNVGDTLRDVEGAVRRTESTLNNVQTELRDVRREVGDVRAEQGRQQDAQGTQPNADEQ
jgi:hypothetical protein